MDRRGAYFFVLDALIGSAIFLITIVIIMGSYLNVPLSKQTYILAEDLVVVMLNTKVIEFRDPYIQTLFDRGNITNPEQSIFEQINEFHYTNMRAEAFNLTRNIINSLLPEQFGASYSIINMSNNEKTIIFNRSVEKINISQRYFSTKKISFFSINQTSYIGPDIVEFAIWN